MLDNTTGWADYPPTRHPNPFDLTVRPGRQVRVAVVVDGGDPRVLWRGWVDEANPGFDAEDGDIVTLECIDAKGEVGRVDVAAVDPPVGAGEVDPRPPQPDLPTAVAWADLLAQLRNVRRSPSSAPNSAAQAADLFDRAADSGGGALFGDVNGKLRYRNRDWQLWPADDVEDATIGNVAPGSLDELALDRVAGRLGSVHPRRRSSRSSKTPPGSGPVRRLAVRTAAARRPARLRPVRVRHVDTRRLLPDRLGDVRSPVRTSPPVS